MATIEDPEFGTITLRRSMQATHVRIRIAPDGRLRASLPAYAPIFLVKRLVNASRGELRGMLASHHQASSFHEGMQIGKSHVLLVRKTQNLNVSVTRRKQHIIVMLEKGGDISEPLTQRLIRDEAIKALRLEAKSYLPKRLAFLANKLGHSYQKVRFSHASGRWGSCNTAGTISLNIALMKLPFELIDYVLVHELSHTKEMNHSPAFWKHVEYGDPQYKTHRARLKREAPSI